MTDRLKEFVDANRDAFDSETPDANIWNRIGIAMNQPAPVRSLRSVRWSLAAAVAVVALIAVALFYHDQVGPTEQAVTNRVIVPEATLDNDSTALYGQQLFHFSQIVNSKFRELERIKREQPELYARFSSDLQKLDFAYQQLKQQLKGQANQEMVLQAMLQDLTLQINLINQQLGIIEQLKNDNHATSTSHL